MTRELLAGAERRAEGADVYGEEIDRTAVEFRAGRLHRVVTGRRRGWGLRVVRDGRLGFAAGTDPGRPDELVDAAVEAAAHGTPAEFEFPPPIGRAELRTVDTRVMVMPRDRMVEWGGTLVDAMRARVPDLVLDVSLRRTYREVRLANSAGFDHGFERAEFELVVDGFPGGDRAARVREYANLSDGRPLALEPLADRLEARARASSRPAALPPGSYPAVVEPPALARLLEPVLAAALGRRRPPAGSALAGREGETVLDPRLTLVDDPRRRHGLATAPWDGDGLPTRRNLLFEAGVFRGPLYDLATGGERARPSTASARRAWDSPPAPGVSNVELLPGEEDRDAALAGIAEGLLVEELAPAGERGILTGDATFEIVSGFRVERGAVTGRVAGKLVGNVFDILARVPAVGAVQSDLGNRFLPFVRCEAVGFAARGRA